MEFYFLRHAIATDRDASPYENDSERPLSKEGVKRMQRIARGMHSLGLSFDLVFSSPYLRARESAELVVREFGLKSSVRFTLLLEPLANSRQLVDQLKKRKGEAQSVLLVGHEPSMTSLISLLLSGEENLMITMKKGGLCKLRVGHLRKGKCASLEWLLTPRQLSRIE